MSAHATARATRAVIIDDTTDLRMLLSIALTSSGFEVVGEAGDGRAGIDLVREQGPDLVMIDLAMPVMDGLEALPTIRSLCPDASIVVLSGFAADQMYPRALEAGADGYVQKGAPIFSIVDYLEKLVAGDRPPPALGLHRTPRSPRPAPRAVPDTATAAADTAAAAATTAMEHAPYGVLVLDGPEHLVVRVANAAARLLLKDPLPPGASLTGPAPELAAAITDRDPLADPAVRVRVGETDVQVTVRREPTGWFVYLVPSADDAGLLRRAIATTAHELRGPVSVITGVAEMVDQLGEGMEPVQRGRLLDSVSRQARMLDGLTADLLTAAQIQGGTLRVDLEEVDPRAVVRGLLTDRPDVLLEDTGDHRVRADPLRLAQVVDNLLTNAVKYARAPYEVRITADADEVHIAVSDRGDGVPETFQPRLFEEFSRAPGTDARGTGMGLYVVRTLAEAQHGRVEHSPRPGGGSTFTVTLPRC